MRWHPEALIEAPFVMAHGAAAASARVCSRGYIHPTVRLPGTRQSMRVPVFWRQPDRMVLPSFGFFTGGANVEPNVGDRVYAVGPERVIALAPRTEVTR